MRAFLKITEPMVNPLKYVGVFVSIVLLWLIHAETIFSQPKIIQGTVLEKDTGEPIGGVHVYFSQTTNGTVTEDDGTFRFTTDLTGIQKIVFSFISYKTITEDINLSSNKVEFTFDIELEFNDFVLGPLEVTASNKEWKKNFSKFRNYFLGNTSLARETEIENSWAISFEEDENHNLVASASEPIVITNRGLGYQIRLDLVEFELNLVNELGHYFFYSSFKELEPRNDWEKRRWLRKRRETYMGHSATF